MVTVATALPGLTPAQSILAAAMSEAQLTEQIRQRCETLGLDRWHTHDSRRSPTGWVDEVIAGPGGAIFRELKRQKGRLTDAQARCMGLLLDAGFNVGVWRPSDPTVRAN